MTLLFGGVVKEEKGQGERNKRNKEKKLDFSVYITLVHPCQFLLSVSFSTWLSHICVDPFLFRISSVTPRPSCCGAHLSHFLLHTFCWGSTSGWHIVAAAKFRPGHCGDSAVRPLMKRCLWTTRNQQRFPFFFSPKRSPKHILFNFTTWPIRASVRLDGGWAGGRWSLPFRKKKKAADIGFGNSSWIMF